MALLDVQGDMPRLHGDELAWRASARHTTQAIASVRHSCCALQRTRATASRRCLCLIREANP